jgi:AcrR family transcriptional regulator
VNERSCYFFDVAKGEETRRRILEHALEMASVVGLGGLSIGELAKVAKMSKSGLFAHFASKEELQLQVLATAAERFIDCVVAPALREPRGEPRLRALLGYWIEWEKTRSGGCPFVAVTYELDDCPGPLRDALVASQQDWIGTLATAARIAIDEGHFRGDLDTEQLAHEIYGCFLAFHMYYRLLHDPRAEERAQVAFERILAHARVA